MKHIIIGTAGHIDHGKTTLIRALTGRNTDRLKEEQNRGISIELGFTYFDLPSGRRAGIIDVPGHEKFIKNMLAGVIGIDIVILVVAADEGVMPQTKEHLAILDLLGIKSGFIVLTKADLVDEEWMELVIDDVENTVKGTFLEGTPIIPVSSTKGTGIEKAIETIDKLTELVEERSEEGRPRLPIDRVFTISGFGTIVTGTLISGKFKVGDEVQVFPGNKTARLRSLQVHDEDTDIAYAGQRVAANLAGLKKSEVNRGDVIAPINSMKETMMLDVKLKILPDTPKIIENRSRLRLYIGTKEVLCRIVLLDKECLTPGDTGYAQLRLEEPTVAKRGDRFILRFYSPMFTIGGGEILEPNPEKKKRFEKSSLEELKIKEIGQSKDILEKIILDKSEEVPSLKDISIYTVMPEEEVIKEIKILEGENKIRSIHQSKDIYIVHNSYLDELNYKIVEELENFHKRRPLKAGISKEEIRSKYFKNVKAKIADSLFNLLLEKGSIANKNEIIYLKDFQIIYTEEQLKIAELIKSKFKERGFLPPKYEELLENINKSEKDVSEVFESLVDRREILKIKDDTYMLKETYDNAFKLLVEFLNKNDSITVSQYRDLLDTNRKISIILLEYFDQNKITKRIDDKRVFF
ncbi:selenocysteine-specific translation elongation factor [Anaerosalibacter sp. Marseille-P3206]|uniref:selenocysteine-specific translation elongation factor n=1 Tax=Anaerosalibacter sp. Marseille-P3206 TaxID=1871005 RepID=UPI0009868AA5|nr:selenocysteine-specific translation elongation factor [Anaerosalibacter sp. Marseille-P3206]